MTFALAERKNIRPRITFFTGTAREGLTNHASPLERFPTADICRANLALLRSIYRDTLYAKTLVHPDNVRITRIDEVIDNNASIIAFDFKRDTAGDRHNSGAIGLSRLMREILRTDNIIFEDVSPLLYVPYVDNWARNESLTLRPDVYEITLTKRLTVRHQLIHQIGNYYEFEDPNAFYALVAISFFDDYKNDTLERLEAEKFWGKDNLLHIVPILSYIAEELFRHHTSDFEAFILGLPEKIGGEEGFGATEAIMEDLIEIYRPYFAYEKREREDIRQQRELLEHTQKKLRNKSEAWRYENRPIIITPEVKAQAHRRMLAKADSKDGYYEFLDEVFSGIEATGKFRASLNEREIRLLRWFLERAPLEKKMEAGQLPIMADILGFGDIETSKWMTDMAQHLWVAILGEDDTIDQSPQRGDTVALYVREGMAHGIQKPFLTMIKVARKVLERKGVNNTALGQSVVTMLDELISGDILNRELGFGNNPSAYEANMVAIMQVLAWVPRYMAETTGMFPEAAEALARYMENYGCLILILDDFNDVRDDIGRRINIYMNGLVRCKEIPEAVRNKFVMICDDRSINNKRKTFQPLNTADRRKVGAAIAIADDPQNKHLVAQSMRHEWEYYYTNALNALDEAFRKLPAIDHRNMYYQLLFRKNLYGLQRKFQSF